jgi:hypothetical protein
MTITPKGAVPRPPCPRRLAVPVPSPGDAMTAPRVTRIG